MRTIAAPLLLSTLALGIAAPAHAAEPPPTTATAPTTVVLVHGAFADGSSWSRVIPLLQAKGLRAVAVQNPLSSLGDDVAAVNRVVRAQPGPVVLVGHSWAGSVITQAGGDERIKALVYVASFAPAQGETSVDGIKGFPAAPGGAHFITDEDGFATLSPASVATYFAQDVSAQDASLIAATQGPVRLSSFGEPITFAAWTKKPSWYVVASKDQMIHPDAQRALAKKIGARTVVLATSHVPMLSEPQKVADVIIEAAAAAAAAK